MSGEIIQESLFSNLEGNEPQSKQLGLDGNPIKFPGNTSLQTRSFVGRSAMPEKGETAEYLPKFFYIYQPPVWITGSENLGPQDRASVKKLREHVQMYGVQSLSNGELLTLVLSTEQGSEGILERMRQLFEKHSFTELLRMDIGELLKKHRLGEAKAAQLQALLEIARRLTIPSIDEKYQIRSPADAARLVIPEMGYLDHEEMRVLLLDQKNCVVENRLLYIGTVNSSVVRTPEVFRHAIIRNCSGLIVCHNHPSGSVEPSQEDLEVTKSLVEAGKLFEIDLIDHIIIGGHNFLSLKERLMWS